MMYTMDKRFLSKTQQLMINQLQDVSTRRPASLVPSPYFHSDSRAEVGIEIGTGYEANALQLIYH